MNRLKEHLKYVAFYDAKKLILRIIVFLVVFGLAFRLISNAIKDFTTNELLTHLNILLLTVTSFYAWVTYKMFVTMRETKSSEIRPQLWIAIEKPKISEMNNDRIKAKIEIPVKVENYGKGPAVNVGVTVSIPYKENQKTREREFTMTFASNDGILQSALTNSGYFFEKNMTLYVEEIPLKPIEEAYLSVKLSFEDLERNLYQQLLFYDLHLKTWFLKYEEFYVISHRKRRYFEDESGGPDP